MMLTLLKTNFPFAQGVFTALLLAGVVFIFRIINNGIDKTVAKIHLSTDNINKLLQLASAFLTQGRIDESLQAYKKILVVEPTNPEALVSLVNIYFAQKKFDNAESYCYELFNNYFVLMPEGRNNLSAELLPELYNSIYCYGYIENRKGNIERAIELKRLSLQNEEYLQEYEDFRNENPY